MQLVDPTGTIQAELFNSTDDPVKAATLPPPNNEGLHIGGSVKRDPLGFSVCNLEKVTGSYNRH